MINTIANKEALAATLTEANGRTQRSVTVEDVTAAAIHAEQVLKTLHISQEEQINLGVTVTVNPKRNRQSLSPSYKYSTNAVQVTLGRTRKGWVVLEAGSKTALRATVANRKDSFINIPSAAFSAANAAEAMGVVLVGE